MNAAEKILVDEKRTEEFENALKELAKIVQDNLGGACRISILDINISASNSRFHITFICIVKYLYNNGINCELQ